MNGQVVRIHASLADDMNAAVNGFMNYCRAKNLSPNTISYYRYRLQAFERFCADSPVAPENVTPERIREFLTAEAEEKSATTANHAYLTLQAFFNFLVSDGFIAENPMQRVDRVKRRRTVIETFTQEQVERILSSCGKDFVGVRDRAMILVMVDCGLRVSELCGLTMDDISWTEQTLLVVGKGDIERVVPFGQAARQALTQFMARRGALDTKTVFVSTLGQPLNRHRARDIIKARCKEAGVTGVRCSPHTFRHTCAVWYLRNGGDVFSLQKLLGHSDLTMTRRYCELSQTDVADKHRLYSPADKLTNKNTSGRKRLK
ncbi:MAG: tyrosine-type recombinase/integrase [Armatimonadetes bacterium]|nr:tyrosine-type recombinase/integrase [Armatimonadota bacterium]